jgi:hypothetical protein
MTTQAWLWWTAGIALALAGLSALAEHRRHGRRDLDKVGVMPWNLILIFALFAAAIAAALALKA